MNNLIIGINGYVVSIDKQNGQELWRTKLKSSTITVVSSDDKRVYASASGFLFCLDKSNGEQLWKNELKGLGYGTCIIDAGGHAALSSSVDMASNVSAATAAATIAACAGATSGGDGS